MGKIDDEICLLGCAIGRAGAPHIFQAANKKLQLYPIRSQFYGENMGPAFAMLALHFGQNVIRDLDPENLPHAGLKGIFLEEAIYFFYVGRVNLVNQIDPHM